jgi:branched-chain amino acid aminotransferase
MESIVNLNGKFLNANEAKISIMDNGFLFGYGVFAGMRVYNNTVFRLESHLSRLQKSSERLGIVVKTSGLRTPVLEIIRANNLKNGQVRITISAGEGSLVPDPRSCDKPTILITAALYNPPTPDIYEKGFKAIISTICRHSGSPVSEMKSINYVESMLARQEARMANYNDALLLNEKGYLSESSSGNVFIVKNKVLKTPPENSGFISGVVREVVLHIAPELDIKAIETNISLKDFFKSDEAFITNSLNEIMPLVSVNDRAIGLGKPGIITRKLMEAFRDQVNRECAVNSKP